TLILGDIGVHTTEDILDKLRASVKSEHIKKRSDCKEFLITTLKEIMDQGETDYEFETKPSVVFVIGVNGVGKTTSIAKIANVMKKNGKKVLLCAADTFRAAAVEQLKIWAERVGVDVISQSEGSDPAAVVFDAAAAARKRGTEVLIIDTAGRLHNKKNLMNELEKINRVVERELPGSIRETLLVLDATTGQNAVIQAKEFKNAADITGIVLTKLDGTAKGGIVLSIKKELSIPVKFIGVGEKVDELEAFDADEFVKALFE
ncbi:MAG: signal recognition particle-docking protein FtsY, partial [Clostridia bacterium]|nr:signal recognition particle-docking protein FtsY [Clostridia bacterium]